MDRAQQQRGSAHLFHPHASDQPVLAEVDGARLGDERAAGAAAGGLAVASRRSRHVLAAADAGAPQRAHVPPEAAVVLRADQHERAAAVAARRRAGLVGGGVGRQLRLRRRVQRLYVQTWHTAFSHGAQLHL